MKSLSNWNIEEKRAVIGIFLIALALVIGHRFELESIIFAITFLVAWTISLALSEKVKIVHLEFLSWKKHRHWGSILLTGSVIVLLITVALQLKSF